MNVSRPVGIARTESLTVVKRLLPGGCATQLIFDTWNGGILVSDSLAPLALTLAWVVVAIALASRMVVRWGLRR